jgi:hypothetical protein
MIRGNGRKDFMEVGCGKEMEVKEVEEYRGGKGFGMAE